MIIPALQRALWIIRTAGWFGVSGIYIIVHAESQKIYVGSTVCFKTRIGHHLCKLRHGKHDNGYLQNAWNLYGEQSFRFGLLEICRRVDLLEREAYWMENTRSCDKRFGFNLDKIAKRKMHSLETRIKISASNTGKHHSDSTKAKLRSAHLGKKHSPRTPEQRERYRKALMGHFVSEETKEKMRAAWVKRKARILCKLSLLN